MTWIRIDDHMPEHPKFVGLKGGAAWLYICGLCYCGRHLTDGRIPKRAVPLLTPWSTTKSSVSALVSAQLWIESDDAFVVNDYLDWQESKTEIERKRSDAAARKRKSRAGHGNVTRDSDVTLAGAHARAPRALSGLCTSVGVEVEEPPTSKAKTTEDARELFSYWQTKCRPAAKPVAKRMAAVHARLAEGYTVEQIRAAIDGAAIAPFIGDDGRRHDDLELICRNGVKLDSFIGRRPPQPKRSAKEQGRLDRHARLVARRAQNTIEGTAHDDSR